MTIHQAFARLQELHPDWHHFVIQADFTLLALVETQIHGVYENSGGWTRQEFVAGTETHDLFTFIEDKLQGHHD